MRLLKLNDQGKLSITEDLRDDNTPAYAILSHTWGDDRDEVKFGDLKHESYRNKGGYSKLRFCGEQAKKDNLEYFWVDTCSIDKSSSAELQEAITSMFRWYRKAARCYVYLSDVSSLGFDAHDKSSQPPYESAFRKSQWFTRGWTLQELLAPSLVEFFSREGNKLGDKRSLEQQIHEITGIPAPVLQGASLSQLTVDERLSWMKTRQTTRHEDKAYSLLGIFGVYMPLMYGEGGDNAFKRLREEINKLTAQNTAFHQPRKPVFMVPFDPDETFIGRKDILDCIDQKLNSSGRRAVLSGIGGVGKSQIAIQFCYRYKSKRPESHVLWVHCGSVARFVQGYKEVAQKLKLPGIQDPEVDIVKTVYDWLSDDNNGSWLLVLDNADDQEIFFGSHRRSQSRVILPQQLDMLARYLPRSQYGSTLITTRDRRVGVRFAGRDKPIDVQPLEAADATSMLRSRLSDHLEWIPAEVAELLGSLEYLPLAIAQAASYISEEDVTIARYLELLRPGNADSRVLLEQNYYDSKRHPDIQNSVFQTWKISFDQIQQQVPRAAEILSLMSMLDKQSIPARFLQYKEESTVLLEKAFGTLKNFSLIRREKTQHIYEIHRLVQLSTQWWLEQENTLKFWQERALETMLRHCPSDSSVENWKAWELIGPHIMVVRSYFFQEEKQKLQCADIIFRLSGYYCALGQYDVAVRMEEEALGVRQELLGKEHPDTLVSMNNLASVLWYQGKYKEAEKICQQTLRLRETVLGREHPHTLTSKNNLALILKDQGKYKEAEEMSQQTLRLQETVLGREHPDTLASMSNLAAALKDQGKYEEAEEIYQQALRLKETVLGKEHPETLNGMNFLATLLKDQGKYKEAEKICQKALGLQETVLGKEHPDTLISMNCLATVLSNQGKHKEAEKICQQALRLQETILGREHPKTLGSMSNLATILSDQGKFEEAEKMYQQILQIQETILGREHPDTLGSMSNLAIVLRDQNRYKEAEEIYQQTLRLQEIVLGREHPDTLTSMSNLAVVLRTQGRYEEAEEIYQQTIRLQETVLGREHPNTLTSMSNLAVALRAQGKYEEAEGMCQQTIRLQEIVLGREHPNTLTSMSNLTVVLRAQGKYKEAEKICQQTLRLQEIVLGREHPSTLTSMSNLAVVLSNQGKYEEAEEMGQQTLRLQETVLGREHPHTLTSMRNLTIVLRAQGKYKELCKEHSPL